MTRVTFQYTDSATKERRECTLTADTFMRHYLRHVLPPGQHRVRYFGWMHPADRNRRMKAATLLAVVMSGHPHGARSARPRDLPVTDGSEIRPYLPAYRC